MTELFDAARAFYNATIADDTVLIRTFSAEKQAAVIAAGERLRAILQAATRAAADGFVDIVFDGPPSHESGRFVEVENARRESINFGEWVKRDDGYWVLRIAASTPSADAVDARRNLEGLRKQVLSPRGIVRKADGWPVHTGARDPDGWLLHPAIPVCDEGTRLDKLLEAFGIETFFVTMEGDDPNFHDRWHEEGLSDCSQWVPTPPTGDGWLLLEIYDTEDGPCALFGRDWYEAEKLRKQDERAERRKSYMAIAAALLKYTPADQNMVDARRYRWLREQGGAVMQIFDEDGKERLVTMGNSSLDAEIDAAIAASVSKGNEND